VLAEAIRAGATTLMIPDTVGYSMSHEYWDLFSMLKRNVPGIENVVRARRTRARRTPRGRQRHAPGPFAAAPPSQAPRAILALVRCARRLVHRQPSIDPSLTSLGRDALLALAPPQTQTP
jgi:hypothetical protein